MCDQRTFTWLLNLEVILRIVCPCLLAYMGFLVIVVYGGLKWQNCFSFPTSCTVDSSWINNILTKERYRIDVCSRGDVRIKFTNIIPNTKLLVKTHQAEESHWIVLRYVIFLCKLLNLNVSFSYQANVKSWQKLFLKNPFTFSIVLLLSENNSFEWFFKKIDYRYIVITIMYLHKILIFIYNLIHYNLYN